MLLRLGDVASGAGRDTGRHLPEAGAEREHGALLERFQDQRIQFAGITSVTEKRQPFHDVLESLPSAYWILVV